MEDTVVEQQTREKLPDRVQDALRQYRRVAHMLKPSFEASPNDPHVRSQISDGLIENTVIRPPNVKTKIPRNAVNRSEAEARMWLEMMVDKAEVAVELALNPESYKILYLEGMQCLTGDERVKYELLLIANLRNRGIGISGISGELESVLEDYTASVRVLDALVDDEKAVYTECAAQMLTDPGLRDSTAIRRAGYSTDYLSTILGNGDDTAIRQAARDIANVKEGFAQARYAELVSRSQESERNIHPHVVLHNATSTALGENRERGSYLVAYNTILDVQTRHQERLVREERDVQLVTASAAIALNSRGLRLLPYLLISEHASSED